MKRETNPPNISPPDELCSCRPWPIWLSYNQATSPSSDCNLDFWRKSRIYASKLPICIVVGAERPWARWGSLHVCLRFARLFVSEHSLIKKTDLLNCATLIRFNCALIKKSCSLVSNWRWLSADPVRDLSVEREQDAGIIKRKNKERICNRRFSAIVYKTEVVEFVTQEQGGSEYAPQQKHAVLCSQLVLVMLNDNVYDSTTSAGLRT